MSEASWVSWTLRPNQPPTKYCQVTSVDPIWSRMTQLSPAYVPASQNRQMYWTFAASTLGAGTATTNWNGENKTLGVGGSRLRMLAGQPPGRRGQMSHVLVGKRKQQELHLHPGRPVADRQTLATPSLPGWPKLKQSIEDHGTGLTMEV